jgi:hypothetical protein
MTNALIQLLAAPVAIACFWAAYALFTLSMKGRADD